MKNKLKLIWIVLIGVSCTSCASLNSKKVLKAPCGPTAGLTDPCGNRVPVNKKNTLENDYSDLISQVNIADI